MNCGREIIGIDSQQKPIDTEQLKSFTEEQAGW